MGAGHTVTALYEIVPPGKQMNLPGVDPLKYQQAPAAAGGRQTCELLTVKVRYIPPEEKQSLLLTRAAGKEWPGLRGGQPDFRFAAAVAVVRHAAAGFEVQGHRDLRRRHQESPRKPAARSGTATGRNSCGWCTPLRGWPAAKPGPRLRVLHRQIANG